MLNINDFNDPDVWDLICEGRTKGVFQLESQLGRSWAKRVKPRNISELAALISLIRPGCLKAMSEGKSMTQHYVDRKKNHWIAFPYPSRTFSGIWKYVLVNFAFYFLKWVSECFI